MSFNSQTEIEGPERKRRLITLLEAWVLLCPAMSYAILGDAPLVVWLAAAPLLLSLAVTTPVPSTSRSGVYSVVIAGVTAVLLNQGYKVDDFRFFLPAPLLFPFLTGLGVAATFFRQTPLSVAYVLSTASLAFMLQGSCLHDPTHMNTRLMLTNPIWNDRFYVFGFFLALQMVAFLPLLYLAQQRRVQGTAVPMPMLRRAVPLLVYAMSVALGASAMVAATRVADPIYSRMDRVLSPIYQWYIRQQDRQLVFPPDKVSLTQTLSPKDLANSERVVVRVRADQPPGYLRGRAYTLYEAGSWKAGEANEVLGRLNPDDEDSALSAYEYFRPELSPTEARAAGSVTMDLYPARHFYSDVLLAPGNAPIVELIAESVQTNADGILSPRRWDEGGAYSVKVPKIDQMAAYQNAKLDPRQSDWYTRVPEDLSPTLKAFMDEAIGKEKRTPEDTMRRISAHLRDSFEYSLTFTLDGDRDPVQQFLTTQRAGHCELFASATVLLLRARGIPARYVTGFVSYEAHPRAGYWLARLGDCHAWVEGWDSATRRWVIVESTPASALPTGDSRSGWLQTRLEQLWVSLAALYAQVKRGYLAEAVFTFLGIVGRFLLWVLFTGPWYLSWPLLLGLAAWLYRRYWRGTRQRASAGPTEAARIELQRALHHLESHLQRYKVRRTPSMSLRDLGSVLERYSVPQAADLLALLRDYEALRYRPTPPTWDAVTALRARVDALRHGGASPASAPPPPPSAEPPPPPPRTAP